MKKFKVILSFILGGLSALLILQNTQVVSIRFLFWEISMSRIILIPLLICIGIGIGFILAKRD